MPKRPNCLARRDAAVGISDSDVIYLDNQATTPTDPRVLEQMIAFLRADAVGNPHSEHHAGRIASIAVERAREQVTALVGADPAEIVFTSGATEANNIAIQGIARTNERRGDHVVTCATEHKCVLECVRHLHEIGFKTTVLPVGPDGIVDMSLLARAMTDNTAIVSIMTANNEIGVLQPIEEIAALCRSHDVVFHTDMAQAAGKIPLDVHGAGVDLASLSGHKLYAPIGIGALFVSEDSPIKPRPLFMGGAQERGMRSGTIPTHLAVAFGAAAELAAREMDADASHAQTLRDMFVQRLTERVADIVVNGASAPRLPGCLSITFPGIDANHLIGAVQPRLAVSANAACSSGVMLPSHVLIALGLSDNDANSTIRIGFGRSNTASEAIAAADILSAAIADIAAGKPAGHAAA